MEPKFNIDRKKISDDEINKHKDFERLVKQFKEQSLQKAKHDKSWWKSKKVRYSAIIAGVTVICTVTYLALFNNQKQSNDKIITSTFTSPDKQETSNQQPGTNGRFISPQSSKLNIPYSSYKVDNARGGEIKHPTSSKIKIPKNSFVDKNGKDIIGEVTIEYREFHDKADIIAGGIPMAYDSAGTKYTLETAGMFDIKGSQNGDPVFIKADKTLDVELASDNSDNRFNQYYLDTVERNWKYIRKDVAKMEDVRGKSEDRGKESLKLATSTKKLETLKKEIEIIIPKKIDSVKVVYTKKTDALPKSKQPAKPAKASGKQTFKIDASPKDFPELCALGNFIFELGDENKNYTPEMNEITWNDLKISEGPNKGINYLLTLRTAKRVEKLIVYPVLSGTDFDKAQKRYQQKFTEYEALVEKRSADEKRLMTEMENKQKAYYIEIEKKKAEYAAARELIMAKLQSDNLNDLNNGFNQMSNQVKATRLFNVSRFGIHNSDCPIKTPDKKSVEPQFTLDKTKAVSPHVVYVVDHTKNIVESYNMLNGKYIMFGTGSDNSLVIFANNKMYLCNKINFKNAVSNPQNKFTVTELSEGADNLIDFKKALEI